MIVIKENIKLPKVGQHFKVFMMLGIPVLTRLLGLVAAITIINFELAPNLK